MNARAARHLLAAVLCGLLAACGDEPAAPPPERLVKGAVMKGPVQNATVKFYVMDVAGDPVDPASPVATVTTGADGTFTAALPNQGVHLLARTFDGSYADESDPTTGPARRRIALPASPNFAFEAVLPPNATSFAITPYSHAMLKKARLQAAGINFFNVFDAVRAQATTAFGFDPITTVPADPLSPSDVATQAARQYGLLLGAASQAINTIATSAGHLPDFADVMLFIDDLGSDGIFGLVSIADEIRRFRNNNFQIYSGLALPVINETLLSQPATVPNARPLAVADAILVSEGSSASVLADSNSSVLDNDTDAEGSTLTAAVGTSPVHGTLVLNSDGTFDYSHDGSEGATDSFTYVANDGTINSLPATVSITVAAVNDAPVAVDDPNYTGQVGGTVTAMAGAGGVRDNDTDADNTNAELSVTATPLSGPSFAASFSLAADGTFSYQHDGSANLVDSFTYEVCDLAGPSQLCDTAVATITLSAGGGTDSLLPLFTNAGDLKLLDPGAVIDGVNNPLTLESGLPTTGFVARTLQRASINAGAATNIREARLVYIKDNGTTRTVWKVNLEAGASHAPVQVSNITDACRINGLAEDLPTPDSSIIRIDTAGTNGVCEDGSGDDFTTAEAWLVPLSTGAGSPGTQVGFGHCCGIAGITNASGALVGVLTTEDDGAGSTFFLARRNVGTLGTPVAIATLDIAGTGQIYAHLSRGLGDQHIYIRAKRTSVDTNYMLLRVNVATNTLTPVFDYNTADAATFVGDFDATTFDATDLYFTSGDAVSLIKVAHAATGEGQTTTLVSGSPGEQILQVRPTPTRLVYEVAGLTGGVFTISKAGGAAMALAQNSASPTFVRLAATNAERVFIDKVSGTAAPVYTAFAIDSDGANASADVADAQWAGGSFLDSCNFNLSCEDTIGLQALYLRRNASTTDALLELANAATGGTTGNVIGTIFNVTSGASVFGGGFGRYTQFTAFAQVGQSDLFLGDSQLASAAPPAQALVAVANIAGGDNQWLLFGTEEGGGGPGGSCVVPPAGLVAWYPGDGDAFDVQAGNNGTLVGGPTFAAGKVSQAFALDGVDDHVFVPANAELTSVGQGSGLTIDLWVNPTALGFYPFVEWNDTTDGLTAGVHFWQDGGAGNLFANIRDTGGGDHMIVTTSAPLTAGSYQHIAVTWDKASGTAVLYHNGSPVQTTNVGAGFTPQTGTKFYVGGARVGNVAQDEYFPGQMDEVEIFDRALSQGEIQSIYAAGSAGKCKPAGTSDADADGLTLDTELALGTNPNNPDTDADGLMDGAEVATSPTNPDTDGDGASDGLEVALGSDPVAVINPVVYVDPSAPCTATCDGTSWGTAYLNEFNVEGSNSISGSDQTNTAYVLFAPGTYGSLDLTSVDRQHVAYIGSLGPGVNTPAFPPTTTFSAGFSTRALQMSQVAAVTIANMRFENGFDAVLGGGVYLAAPVHSTQGQNTATLHRVQVDNNASNEAGGGVVANGSGNLLTVELSEVTNNQALGASASLVRGGGLLAQNTAQVTVTDTLVSGNTVTCAQPGCSAFGAGAAVNGGASSLIVTNSIVESNTASTGAGALAAGGGLSSTSSGSLSVSTTEVRNNAATVSGTGTAAGGGIASSGGDIQVDDSVVRGNASSGGTIAPPLGGGGGIYVDSSGTLSMARSIVADNKAAAGPGGGVNMVDSFNSLLQDNKLLSNSSLNPGGALHIHPQGTTSVFNNLFVGNVVTDAAGEGGAVELDIETGNPALSFDSNTVAYNQTRNSTGTGGGISIKSTPVASMDLHNNQIWFNKDSTPAFNTGEEYLRSGSLTVSGTGNNIDESGLPGNLGLIPGFVQGFYLDPLQPSPGINNGDNTFAGPLVSPPYTTNPNGTADSVSPAVDIGFHHRQASSGSLDSVDMVPLRTSSCSSTDNFFFVPVFAGAPNGEPGHLVVVELTGVTPPLSSLMTIDPRSSGSRVARDLGDGRYAVTTTGFQSGSAPGSFSVYVDENTTPQTFTVTFTNGC